ncbi:MAG: TlyA family RNA methyltransferase [Ruminococcaceae bacterium]|nr:TlyA family RNA methyltransferase [Oscillospiraceae bacterium]
MRLDVYLTETEMTKSRSQAVEYIKAGLVSVNGSTSVKPSLAVSDNDTVLLLGRTHEFVGRGGVKLDHALKHFGISADGMCAVDIGASTGGFTDCLLKHGADFVLAVDSGHDQLDESLRADNRVKSLEGFNARDLTPDTAGFLADIAVTDVSFISQTLILTPAYSILKDDGIYIGLIKPQFECGISALNKKGIVKDKKHYIFAINKVAAVAIECGFSVAGLTRSPVTGGDGNTEFLIYLKKSGEGMSASDFEKTVCEVCS